MEALETSRGLIRTRRVGVVAAGNSSVVVRLAGVQLPLESFPLHLLAWQDFQAALEFGYIQGERGLVAPLEDIRIRVNKKVEFGEGLAELVEQVAQVGTCLRFGSIGPEEASKLLARNSFVIESATLPMERRLCRTGSMLDEETKMIWQASSVGIRMTAPSIAGVTAWVGE